MFPGVRSFLVFSSLGFKPPASGFQSYSYSSLKTFFFHTAMMIKTSRLMVQRLFTMRDTQRSSQSYMDKRKGRREIEVIRRRIAAVKGERTV